jgi:hypothetical protein
MRSKVRQRRSETLMDARRVGLRITSVSDGASEKFARFRRARRSRIRLRTRVEIDLW